ncbi:urease subunit gamma, partial [Mesorhizobium sp. Root552]|uniref:urease subunit gamma n=1 Tax=Mesorhizobium sp. Root552 TaxID=1736555 RepID=UPI0019103C3B
MQGLCQQCRGTTLSRFRDLGGRLLTTDDVEPGVADMVPMIYIECLFAEGTKVMAP